MKAARSRTNATGGPLDLMGIPSDLRPTVPEWAQMSPARLRHVQRVAIVVAGWAEALGVPDSERNRWLRAVWLHDALRDAPADELERLAPGWTGPMAVRHGPAAAALAKAEGETDRGVLDAVRYHSIGLAEWDLVGRVLYCADYLEPGRRAEPVLRAELVRRFPDDPPAVVLTVARRRLQHHIALGRTLPEPTIRFWNHLVAAPSSPAR